MTLVLGIIYAIVGCITLGLVLLHSGKGGGLSDMFGGGLSGAAAGSTQMERNLDRLTGTFQPDLWDPDTGVGLHDQRLIGVEAEAFRLLQVRSDIPVQVVENLLGSNPEIKSRRSGGIGRRASLRG